MLNSAVVIFTGLVALRCAIIAALCFAFWHWLKLRALPWVGAWYIAGFVAELIGGYYFVQWAPPEWKTHGRLPPPPGLAALSLSMGLLAEISALLAVLLIFSEAAFVMRRLYPDYRPLVLRFLFGSYTQVFALGLACVLFGIVGPLLPVVWCCVRGRP